MKITENHADGPAIIDQPDDNTVYFCYPQIGTVPKNRNDGPFAGPPFAVQPGTTNGLKDPWRRNSQQATGHD
jgi:hypothetical protein